MAGIRPARNHRRSAGILTGAALVLVMTFPSLLLADMAAPHDVDTRAEFRKFDAGYKASRNARYPQVVALAQKVQALEDAGIATQCAQQMLTQLRWRLNNTADFAGVDQEAKALGDEIARLQAGDRQVGGAPPANLQDPGDGAWGRCYSEWFLRLDASYDAISGLVDQAPPVKPVFLDRVNDPDKLQSVLENLFHSTIASDGIYRRRAYNEVVADIMRLILRDQPAGYGWHAGVKERLLTLLMGSLRDPATGMWGVTDVIDGKAVYIDDISLTFHIVKYLHGYYQTRPADELAAWWQAVDWPRLIDALLAVRGLRYPQGWVQAGSDRAGSYLNHDLYDVVTLLRLGWPSARDDQRPVIQTEMQRLLDYSLAKTVSTDGTVKVDENDDSVETAYYFAIGFLDEIGYLDRCKRFWTGQDFPEAAARLAGLRRHVEAGLKTGTGGEGGVYYRAALERLDAIPARGDCNTQPLPAKLPE